MYELLGISLVLATLLTINTVASILMAAGWRLFGRSMQIRSARLRAEILFAMRIAAPAIALIAVGLLLIPSYLGYEPYASGEVVSKKLATLALISGAGVLFALWRGFRSWLATHFLLREWLRRANQIKLADISIPTFRIVHSFPIIAIIGTWRPRLFIAESVLETLSDEEFRAAIAHECGHLAARDNLKRFLLRVCRDALMIVPCGRSLDRAWAETAEAAADEHAAQQDSKTALNLAAALVKIARMVPSAGYAAIPAATFLVGDETRGVKARVRRLLEMASSDRVSDLSPSIARFVPATSLLFLVAIGSGVAANPKILLSVHALVERVVSILS